MKDTKKIEPVAWMGKLNYGHSLTTSKYQADDWSRYGNVTPLYGKGAMDRIEVLENALKFYADVSKYPSPYTGGLGKLYFDCGGAARRALGWE